MSEMTVWFCLLMALSIVVAAQGVLVAYLTRRQLRSEEEATHQWVRIQDLFRQVSAMKARRIRPIYRNPDLMSPRNCFAKTRKRASRNGVRYRPSA